ncbi:MAG: hemolysin family protein [Clostridia bacterium]|nr:hemolysin family protein [Clostridia bacterium]
MAIGSLKRLFKKESSTEEEIKQLVDDDEGELEKSTRDIINNLFEFDDTNVGDIMTHRTDIAAVEITGEIIDVVKVAIDEGFSRIPVYEEDLDNIKGIVYVKDLLKFVGTEIPKGEKIEDYIRTPLFVPETIPCGKLFAQMTETHIQLAIVVDEYGGTAGLVTMEDIIEELVGEIEDEYDDEEQSVTQIDENTFVFDGACDIEDVGEALGINLPEGDYNTVAGFVINRLGTVPNEESKGEAVEYGGVRFTVLDVTDRKIDSVKAEIYDRTNNND